jgi:hypothetical protein
MPGVALETLAPGLQRTRDASIALPDGGPAFPEPQRARADSNGRPLAPEASALSTELRAQEPESKGLEPGRRAGRGRKR